MGHSSYGERRERGDAPGANSRYPPASDSTIATAIFTRSPGCCDNQRLLARAEEALKVFDFGLGIRAYSGLAEIRGVFWRIRLNICFSL